MCAVIFAFSQDAHSGRHSEEVLGWLLRVIGMNSRHLRHAWGEPFRKFAHVVVYFLLGATAYYGFAMGRRQFYWLGGLRTVIFCAAYASLDEYHQSFVPGRGVEASDVALDTAAGVLALVVVWLLRRRWRGAAHQGSAITTAE